MGLALDEAEDLSATEKFSNTYGRKSFITAVTRIHY
jgi:hypothetical protein